MKHLGFAVALPLLLLAAPSLAQNAGDAARGKQIYMKDACYTCHGTVGEGGAAGPKIAHTGLPAAAIKQQLREPRAQMPPYSAKILSDAEVGDIVAYIESLSQSAATPVKDIPLLNQ